MKGDRGSSTSATNPAEEEEGNRGGWRAGELKFKEYLNKQKPGLLRVEVGSVHEGIERFPYPFNEESFNKCFRIRVVSSLVEIEECGTGGNIQS
jgi:hypothetical protein